MRPEHGRDGQFDFDAVDFVTSDHHFGHARISELAGRPFSTVDEMNTVLIERWNALVKPDDVVLHLGDLALGPIEQSVALTSQLNGTRLLVPGNHDRISPATQSQRAIERFRPMYQDAGWTILPEILNGCRRGNRLVASHYPYTGDTTGIERHRSHRPTNTGIPLLHGHTHERDLGPHGYHEFHVGVDAFDFAPIQFELIDAWLEDLRREEEEIAAIVRERSKSGASSSLAALARSFGVDLDEGAEARWKDLSGSADSEARIWDELSSAAERGELRPTGNIRRKAELDAIRERIRRRDGEVTPEAFLRAVFGLDS